MPKRSRPRRGARSGPPLDPALPLNPTARHDDRPQPFISYAHEDEWFAELVEFVLADHGVDAWFAPAQIQPGEHWIKSIGRGLDRCNWFLLVMSPAVIEATWVQHELFAALNAEKYKDKILPLYLEECEYRKLAFVLPNIQRIDFRSDFNQGFRDLLKRWRLEYRGHVDSRQRIYQGQIKSSSY